MFRLPLVICSVLAFAASIPDFQFPNLLVHTRDPKVVQTAEGFFQPPSIEEQLENFKFELKVVPEFYDVWVKYLQYRPFLLSSNCKLVTMCSVDEESCLVVKVGREFDDVVHYNGFGVLGHTETVPNRPWKKRLGMDRVGVSVSFNGTTAQNIDSQFDPGTSVSFMRFNTYNKSKLPKLSTARLVCVTDGTESRMFGLLLNNVSYKFVRDSEEYMGDLILTGYPLPFGLTIGWQVIARVPVMYLPGELRIGHDAVQMYSTTTSPQYEIPYEQAALLPGYFRPCILDAFELEFPKPPSLKVQFATVSATRIVDFIVDPQSPCSNFLVTDLPLESHGISIDRGTAQLNPDPLVIHNASIRLLLPEGMVAFSIYQFDISGTILPSSKSNGQNAIQLWGCARTENPKEHPLLGNDFLTQFDVHYDPINQNLKLYAVNSIKTSDFDAAEQEL